jgi:hypothetical protein
VNKVIVKSIQLGANKFRRQVNFDDNFSGGSGRVKKVLTPSFFLCEKSVIFVYFRGVADDGDA